MVFFSVYFDGIPNSFGLAMGNLSRLHLVKIRTMAPPNSPDIMLKRSERLRSMRSAPLTELHRYVRCQKDKLFLSLLWFLAALVIKPSGYRFGSLSLK